MAMTPTAVTPGWSRSDPPRDRVVFDAQMSVAVYAVDCRGVTVTGWASSMPDDTTYDWRTMLVTTSDASGACADTRSDLVVRQGGEALPASPWIGGTASGVGSVVVVPFRPGSYWSQIPSPRPGQWVGIGGRAADGTMLPILDRRIVAVGPTSFTLDQAVGAEYLGAPVADNLMRILGSMTRAGTEVTGSPVYCIDLFDCADPATTWWDITAPTAPRSVKAVGGKGRVTVTWKPAASDGGAPADYRYSVNGGPWTDASGFRVSVKARKGAKVTVSVESYNAAGWGPSVTTSARAN